MNENGTDNVSKLLLFQQRRTQSVDEHALQILNDDIYGRDDKNRNRTLKNRSHDIIKECDDNYIHAALPRTNNRPTAKTCWLVF
jgi:hypothetical protein